MAKSLRWRIQAWYAGLLLVVLLLFCSLLYWRLHQFEYQRVDGELRGAANTMIALLRGLPPQELQRGDGTIPFPEEPLPPPPNRRGTTLEDELARVYGDGQPPVRRWQYALRPPPEFLDRHRDTPHYYVVWQQEHVLAQSDDAPTIQQLTRPLGTDDRRPEMYSADGWRHLLQRGPADTFVAVGRSTESERSMLRRWLGSLIALSAGVFTLGLLGAAWLSHRALRPIAEMSLAASKISADNLQERLDDQRVVAELSDLAHTLNQTFERLQNAFERQAAFTADASHELRTPLTILQTQLEVLSKKATGETRDGLEVCQRAAKRMTGLVEQLLVLARADSGKLQVTPEPFEFSSMIEECLDLLQPSALKASVELRSDLQPCKIHGDPRLLSQVVINLVSNAIHYNRPGGHVEVDLKPVNNQVVLEVRDTGRGIAAELQPRVFERFFRVDRSRSRQTGGNGLGLAITRSIVESHGGSITLTSEPDQGSCFRVVLKGAV